MAKTNITKTEAFRAHPVLVVILVIIVLLMLAAVILYPAARDYYYAMRENQRLNAEYEEVLNRNNKIQQRIDELNTPEGIADKAREELGWVLEGEEAVNITGLGQSEVSTGLPSDVKPGSVRAPEDWWTQTLDEFFGYEPPNVDNPQLDDTIPGL